MNISISKRTAMQFVVLLGIVSLLGDMTYEGARSITGPYLALLGASATVVGVVAGFGELIGLRHPPQLGPNRAALILLRGAGRAASIGDIPGQQAG